MKIRMLTGISGPDICLTPKEETDRLTREESIRLMLSGQAEPADEEAEEALASILPAIAGLAVLAALVPVHADAPSAAPTAVSLAHPDRPPAVAAAAPAPKPRKPKKA